MSRSYLPRIGDGTGGTAAVGDKQLITADAIYATEVLDARGHRVIILPPRIRKQFVAIDAVLQKWSFTDSPNTFPAADVTDLPAGGGGGPHADEHENGGADEISVAGLAGLLADSQTPVAHAHVIADTTGLQTALDAKADDAHSHVVADTTGLQTALDAKADDAHTHAIGDVTGLQGSLDAKADDGHTHAQSDITNLVSDLAGKADATHDHTAAEVVSGTLAIARIPTGQTGTTVPFGNDARFTDARTPVAHASSHLSAGGDAIKLDDLAAPDDNTDLDASTTKHGLMKKFPGGTTTFLRADGSFASPPGGGGEAFPVGSVFIAVVSTDPATLLGYGTWSAFAAGRVLVGRDAGQTEFDTVEETGGAKTHTLTEAEIPAHTHTVSDPGHAHVEQNNSATTGGLAGWGARDTSTNTAVATGYSTQSAQTGVTVEETGGGGAHNNLQPYIVVYMWKRTA